MASVRVADRTMDSLTLHYVSHTPMNLLRIAIPVFPGWRATLDGVELPLLTADVAFIGVLVPAGEGDIHLAYNSRYFAPAAAISSLALLAVALVFLRTSFLLIFSRKSAARL